MKARTAFGSLVAFLGAVAVLYVSLVSTKESLEHGAPAAEPEKTYLTDVALSVIGALDSKDLNALAEYIHPVKGVRFTPYTHVRADLDLVVSKHNLGVQLRNRSVHLWGHHDGSRRPIMMTFEQYFDEFIYSREFAQTEGATLNQDLTWASSEDNARRVYPDSEIIMYRFAAPDPATGVDEWGSLRLVFENYLTQWVLVGIIHDQETGEPSMEVADGIEPGNPL